jgi:hypothetical protein
VAGGKPFGQSLSDWSQLCKQNRPQTLQWELWLRVIFFSEAVLGRGQANSGRDPPGASPLSWSLQCVLSLISLQATSRLHISGWCKVKLFSKMRVGHVLCETSELVLWDGLGGGRCAARLLGHPGLLGKPEELLLALAEVIVWRCLQNNWSWHRPRPYVPQKLCAGGSPRLPGCRCGAYCIVP